MNLLNSTASTTAPHGDQLRDRTRRQVRRIRRIRRRHERVDPLGRALVLGAAVLACVMLATHLDEIQSWEAQLATMLLRPWTGGTSFSRRDVYFVPTSSTGIVGFQVTPECSVALMGLPLLIVSAIILQFPRVRWTRWYLGTAAALSSILVANQIRLLTIVGFTVPWGIDGYEISHQIIGTVIGLAGFVVALLLLVGVTTRPRLQTRARMGTASGV